MNGEPVSTVSPAGVSTAGLQQSLGLFDSTMIVAGSMIGTGIFIVSADMARTVGSVGMAARLLDHYRFVDDCRGFILRRTGRDDASGRRSVRLSARGLVAFVRILVRLDLVYGDPDRNGCSGRRGVRSLSGHSVAAHLRKCVHHSAHSCHQRYAISLSTAQLIGVLHHRAPDLEQCARDQLREADSKYLHLRQAGRFARRDRGGNRGVERGGQIEFHQSVVASRVHAGGAGTDAGNHLWADRRHLRGASWFAVRGGCLEQHHVHRRAR